MVQVIKISLSIPLIRETIENETFRRGHVDKATNEGAALLAYLEAADTDDNSYQTRVFLRDLYAAVEESKTLISDFLNNRGDAASSNISTEANGDLIVYQLEVSSRFNKAMSAPLARSLSKYIEDYILSLWWAVSGNGLMQVYQAQMVQDIVSIKRCFNKLAPKPPAPYTPTMVRVRHKDIHIPQGRHFQLAYIIDYGAVDDIRAKVRDKRICSATRMYDAFDILALKEGRTDVILSSQSDNNVRTTVSITVDKYPL